MIKLKKITNMKQVSEVTGIGQNRLCFMRQGRDYRTSTVDKLCSYYGKQPWELFERIKEEEGKEGEDLKRRKWYNGLKNKRFDKLYALLEERGISRYRLSLDCGLGKDTVAKIKNQNVGYSYDSVIAFTKYLDCNLNDICEWDKDAVQEEMSDD